MPFIPAETLHSVPPEAIYKALQADPWVTPMQRISSAGTDTNVMEVVDDTLMRAGENTDGINAFADLCFGESKTVLDVGGGRSNFNQNYMQKTRGIQLSVWDPFNRPGPHNKLIQQQVEMSPVDAATSMSVLNVIPDLKARLNHIHLIFKAITLEGRAYFKIWPGEYELRGTGLPVESRDKYQANAHAQRFIFEIQAIFGTQHVKLHPSVANLVVAVKRTTHVPGIIELLTISRRSNLFHISLRRKQEGWLDQFNKIHINRALKVRFFHLPRPPHLTNALAVYSAPSAISHHFKNDETVTFLSSCSHYQIGILAIYRLMIGGDVPISAEIKRQLSGLITTNPDEFVNIILTHPDAFSHEFALSLDECDSLAYLREWFDLSELLPFAGHSLGPVFKLAIAKQSQMTALRTRQLHSGHFPQTQGIGGNWFDCDKDENAILAMQQALGFSHPCEFLYTHLGLSDNLSRLISTFYKPSAEDWQNGKSKIGHLGTEFFSDQAVVHSVIKGEIATLKRFGIPVAQPLLNPASHVLKIEPDDLGLYSDQAIIDFIRRHAHELQLLQLPDIVFSTGQRLDLPLILTELKETIEQHRIFVGLDLAHTVGNRTIDLKALPVTYAVGCSYKHCCGSAGAGFGIYVREEADLEKYPPIQGWKAADSNQVFGKINTFDPSIMMQKGAWAFRCSNPSPMAVAEVQEYMKIMSAVGWDKLTAKSECLTRYMYWLLKIRFNDNIQFITPIDSRKRGATLVFRIHGLAEVSSLESMLKDRSEYGQFDVDTRPPNNIRVTAHYGYSRFVDIVNMVSRLEQVVTQVLEKQRQEMAQPKVSAAGMFSHTGSSTAVSEMTLKASI